MIEKKIYNSFDPCAKCFQAQAKPLRNGSADACRAVSAALRISPHFAEAAPDARGGGLGIIPVNFQEIYDV